MVKAHLGRDRSDETHAVLDAESRRKKGIKIVTILEEIEPINNKKVLDIGTGAGYISVELAKNANSVESVDITDERRVKEGYKFSLIENEKLPFKDSYFDIVVSNHVIEHTPNQLLHIEEALRVLKSGGLLYIATPNKLWLSDPHYKLPFVSWLPRTISNRYVQLTGRGDEWDIYPISIFGIRKLTSKYRYINGLSLMLKSKKKENIDVNGFVVKILRKMPSFIDNVLLFISPTIIVVIEKARNK